MINPIIYALRFVYRIKYWLIICPFLVAIAVAILTDNLRGQYRVKSTVYTGVMSGYNLESDGESFNNQASVNNAMDNLVNIILAESTLKRVSMRLFAQHMMYGNPNENTKYITAQNYREIYGRVSTHKDVLALIDKTSEENTLRNLYDYEKDTRDNFVFGLFNWEHPIYSHKALSKIEVKKLGNSDMLDVRYASSDPGVAYNTLVILNEEFIKQYEELRFGETNDVIKYFEGELERVKGELRGKEDDLTVYNTEKQIINFDEQTKYVAALGRDFDLKYEEILLTYSSSEALIKSIEKRIDFKTGTVRDNLEFLNRMNKIASLSSQITSLNYLGADTLKRNHKIVEKLNVELEKEERNLVAFSQNIISQQYSKEGVSSLSLLDQWITEIIKFEKASAELKVMHQRKIELDKRYAFFSPVGSTIKRKERDVIFSENTYKSILESLNEAHLRKRNLQMTSSTLKIINPPTFPLSAESAGRRMIVGFSFFATFVFLFGCFIILELLDRTLRDKPRTERLTSTTVVGALPKKSKLRFRVFNKKWSEIAAGHIGNSIMANFHPNTLNIINVLSNTGTDGKSELTKVLEAFYRSEGFNVKVIYAGSDFPTDTRDFHMSSSVRDLYKYDGEDVVIVEYPPLRFGSVPVALFNEANLNLLAIRANRSWKDVDQILLDGIKTKNDKILIVLTDAHRMVVESFTGLLPPFTMMRRLTYRIYQLGLTSVEKYDRESLDKRV